MPADRAGYDLVVYAIDVSPPMGQLKEDLDGKKRTKLEMAKEYVARRCEPKISSGRKTEAIGVVSYGGRTNNQANQAFVAQNPEDDDPPYAAVSSDVAIQTAKPKTVETVLNLCLGKEEGNPISALMVALDMIQTHKHTKSWALEVVLITDGESAFRQDEYEDLMMRFDDLGVKLTIVGIDFQHPELPVQKDKTRNKRLSEKFWRTFFQMLNERMAPSTSSEAILPSYTVFDEALAEVRLPRPAVVNGTVSGIDLHIGSPELDPEQAITIPIKYSKATMKARPPSLSKAWKPAMDLQKPQDSRYMSQAGPSSQLASSLQAQSQAMGARDMSDMAGMISAEVKHYTSYVIKRQPGDEHDKGKGKDMSQVDYGTQGLDDEYRDEMEEPEVLPEEEEEPVAKEDIVKAWRFGSTWVPMEADTFEPLDTRKGVEILGFFPRSAVKRHLLMGEVRFVWPDMTSPKGQIQFSSLVEAMALREMVALVRWVLKDQAEPVIGLCVPEMDYPGEDKRLDYMFWIKLPFAEDEHNFWFPSLTQYKTASGKVVTEHPLLPTDEQCKLMDELVQGMDLDAFAAEQAKANGDQDGDEEMEESETPRWFEPSRSYNPVIHRIKEAIFHASTTSDLDKDPLGPPHPELTKYFETPEEVLQSVEKVMEQLKESLKIKKVPPKMRRKAEKSALGPNEGYIDIDELFDETKRTQAKEEPATPKRSEVKGEVVSPDAPVTRARAESQDSDILPPQQAARAKPKRGRLISNERPLQDFKRLIEGEGDVFKKALQDMGTVIKENVEASFSRQAFPLAIDCLKEMRETALMYEEVETYNEYLDDLEKFITDPAFKHKDFWESVKKAGKSVEKITPEEAQAALEGDY